MSHRQRSQLWVGRQGVRQLGQALALRHGQGACNDQRAPATARGTGRNWAITPAAASHGALPSRPATGLTLKTAWIAPSSGWGTPGSGASAAMLPACAPHDPPASDQLRGRSGAKRARPVSAARKQQEARSSGTAGPDPQAQRPPRDVAAHPRHLDLFLRSNRAGWSPSGGTATGAVALLSVPLADTLKLLQIDYEGCGKRNEGLPAADPAQQPLRQSRLVMAPQRAAQRRAAARPLALHALLHYIRCTELQLHTLQAS